MSINFAASVESARRDLEGSARIRYQYRRNPSKVISILAGRNKEVMYSDSEALRSQIRSSDSNLRLVAFLILCDVCLTTDALNACVQMAFHDESVEIRGFAIEKLCRKKEFYETTVAWEKIASVINLPTNDEVLIKSVSKSWFDAVNGYISAEHILQIADELN